MIWIIIEKNTGEGKLFLTVECQLVNVEGMTKLEIIILVIIDSSKNQTQILIIVGKSLMRKSIFT